MKKFTQSLKVRSYELDSQGHVNYAVYLNYLEYARVLTMEQHGLSFQDFVDRKRYVVVAEINVKYLAPAFMGDELEITVEAIKAGKTSGTFKQEIFRKKDIRYIHYRDGVTCTYSGDIENVVNSIDFYRYIDYDKIGIDLLQVVLFQSTKFDLMITGGYLDKLLPNLPNKILEEIKMSEFVSKNAKKYLDKHF